MYFCYSIDSVLYIACNIQHQMCSCIYLHVHVYTSQPEITEILCKAIVTVAEVNGGHLVEKAKDVAELFKKTFNLFSCCHIKYNAKYATDSEIAQLGEYNIYM